MKLRDHISRVITRSRPGLGHEGQEPTDELTLQGATAVYAEAIASTLECDDKTISILKAASLHVGEPAPSPDEEQMAASWTDDGFHDVVETVLYYREHRDSPHGFPGGASGEMIPVTARILAVAEFWAEITTGYAWHVQPARAIQLMQEHAGTRFDPWIVAAVERATSLEDAARSGLDTPLIPT